MTRSVRRIVAVLLAVTTFVAPALADDCSALVAEVQTRLDSKQIDSALRAELQGRLTQASALCKANNAGDGMAYASDVAGQLDTL